MDDISKNDDVKNDNHDDNHDNQKEAKQDDEKPINVQFNRKELDSQENHDSQGSKNPQENHGIEVADYLGNKDGHHQPYKAPEENVYDDKLPPPIRQDEPIMPHPVIHDHNHGNNHEPVTPIIIVALILITFGFGGGFFGYKYSPQIASLFSSTANEEVTQDSTANKTANWATYTNTKYKYSLKYPEKWSGQNIKNKEADTISFTNYDPEGDSSGSKISVSFQESNGKTLDTWIASQKVVTNEQKGDLQSLTVGGKSAFQEEITGTINEINTYLVLNTKIMIISLEAPTSELSESKSIYNQILTSVKFN